MLQGLTEKAFDAIIDTYCNKKEQEMKKFLITWDSGYADGETTVSAESASKAEFIFSQRWPEREVFSVKAL